MIDCARHNKHGALKLRKNFDQSNEEHTLTLRCVRRQLDGQVELNWKPALEDVSLDLQEKLVSKREAIV